MQFQNKFNDNTSIIGVIGHPIRHSFSPLMHNISFELGKLNYVYLPFDVPVENLKDAIKGMVALGIKGFNVTIPLKEKITEYLSDVSEEAGVIGSINTVVNENGTLLGYNTDVYGIIKTLNPFKKELADATVSIIGAGGAARSVIYTLIRHFKVKEINIINRTVQKAESLREYFSAKMHFDNTNAFDLVPPDLVKLVNNSKLIINTTSIGMSPNTDDSPFTIEESFTKDQIVFDVVANPIETTFLKLAKLHGARVLNGLTMFVEQGAHSYELWTGEKMPVKKIYKILESYLTS